MSSELKTIILVVSFAKCLVFLGLFLGLGLFARKCLRTNASILIFTSLTFLELIMLFLSTALMIFWLKIPAQRLLRLIKLVSSFNLFLFGLLAFAAIFYAIFLFSKIVILEEEELEIGMEKESFELAIRLIPVVIFLSALLSILDMVVVMQISADIDPHFSLSFY
jgi:hypothetical protein